MRHSRPSLAKEVERRGGFTVVEAIDAVRRIAVGLADLHAKGVIHRDVKPGTVLVGNDGRLLLSDLGLAATMTFTESLSAPRLSAPTLHARRCSPARGRRA